MDTDTREQFSAIRRDTTALRRDVREDIKGLHAKLDAYVAAINARCERRGEEIAVLLNHDRERTRWIDRRIALGLLIITAFSVLLRLAV